MASTVEEETWGNKNLVLQNIYWEYNGLNMFVTMMFYRKCKLEGYNYLASERDQWNFNTEERGLGEFDIHMLYWGKRGRINQRKPT